MTTKYQKKVNKKKELIHLLEKEIDNLPQVIELRKKINRHNIILDKLMDDCPHDNYVKEKRYYSGSYLNHANTTHWKECLICGYKFDFVDEIHSWYG
jgi:hypothetical protein